MSIDICRVIFVNTPLFDYISLFFCASSILSLHRINKQCFAQCEHLRKNKIFTKRIHAALQARGLDPISFNRVLKQSHAKLSGSFILQAMNNEPWIANDLDLITTLSDISWVVMHNYFWELVDRDWKRYENLYELSAPTHLYHINPDTHIQCIFIQTPKFVTIEQFVTDNFDNDYLKNTFDGQSLILYRTQSLITRSSEYHINASKKWAVPY